MKTTDTKIKATGQLVRVTKYLDAPIAYDFKKHKEIIPDGMSSRAERRKNVKEAYWSQERIDEERKENRKRAMFSAASRLSDWVNCNAWQYRDKNGRLFLPVFATFTFKKDIRDIETANEIYTLFIKRLNFYIGKDKKAELRYINVVEFQDQNRNGVIHYHTLFFNLPYVYGKKLEKIWANGGTDIRKVDKVKNLARYLTKYMVKGFDDPRLDGKKRYTPSMNLIKPTIIRDEQLAKAVLFHLPEDKLHKVREFESSYVGRVKTLDFILDKGETLDDVIDIVL